MHIQKRMENVLSYNSWRNTGEKFNWFIDIRHHRFSTYAKFSEKLTFLTPETHTYVCVSGVRNISFSENLAYLVNG